MHILINSLGEIESDDDESIFAAPDEDWQPSGSMGMTAAARAGFDQETARPMSVVGLHTAVDPACSFVEEQLVHTDLRKGPPLRKKSSASGFSPARAQQTSSAQIPILLANKNHSYQRSVSSSGSETSISSVESAFSLLSLGQTSTNSSNTNTEGSAAGINGLVIDFDHPEGDWLKLKVKPTNPKRQVHHVVDNTALTAKTKPSRPFSSVKRADFNLTKIKLGSLHRSSKSRSLRPDSSGLAMGLDSRQCQSANNRNSLNGPREGSAFGPITKSASFAEAPTTSEPLAVAAAFASSRQSASVETAPASQTRAAGENTSSRKLDLSYIDKASLLFADRPLFETLPRTSKVFELDNKVAEYRKQASAMRVELASLHTVVSNKIEFYKLSVDQRSVVLNRQEELRGMLSIVEKKRYETGLQLARTLHQQRRYEGQDIWVRSH